MSDIIADLDWSEIFTTFQPKIHAYIFRRTSDHVLSEDLTSDTFVKAIVSDRDGNGARTSLSGWLYRIAHNLVIDHYRTRDRQKSVSIDEIPHMIDKDSDPVKAAEIAFDFERLESAMTGLPDTQIEVMNLRFMDGYSFEEIGFRMGKSEQACKAIVHRARATINYLLASDAAYPRRHNGCFNNISEVLREHGPLIASDIAMKIQRDKSLIAHTLRYHSSSFFVVGTYKKRGIETFIWGLVGIHDQKEAA